MEIECGRYRKKPIEVEAFRLTAKIYDMPEVWPAWARNALKRGPAGLWRVPTLEGEMAAKPGTWIVRGIVGELYPVQHEIFTATYDVAG